VRWVWLVIWALEFVAALVALPVGLTLVVLGHADGWLVLLIAIGLIVGWAIQYFVFGRDPDPIL
jgi:hypothetical protein